MSVSVGFSSGSKRENSTLQLAMGATYNCNLKNGCDMLNPTLLLSIDSDAFPNYTAFRIENRYYKVTDIRSVRDNLFEISGTVDVLATYKSNILATTAYVIYDNVPNTELVDNRLPMVTTKSVSVSRTACPLAPDAGCFILSLTGSHNTTGIYKVSEAQLAALIDDVDDISDNIFDFPERPRKPTTPTGMSVADAILELLEAFKYMGDMIAWGFECIKLPVSQFFGSANVVDNIRECKYIPFNRGTTSGANTIYLGTFKTKQSFAKLNTDTVFASASVSIPWQANDWRRRSPFTEVYLYMPYIGMQQISSENIVGQTTLSVGYALGMRDGSLIATVKCGDQVIGQYSGNVGAEAPVGASNINMPRAGQAIISGAKSVAEKNIAGIGMAAIDFGDAITPHFSCIGGLDGIAGTATDQNITCYTVFHDTNVAPNTGINTIGAPTMAPKSLGSCSNYVQTIGASVAGSMTSTERAQLNSLLDNGIFIE